MFEESDFKIFDVTSLAGRMTLIKDVIDPKFEQSAATILPILNKNWQQWYAHVAKHLRRTTYAPDNTWVAFAPNKRGYKMMPHFELGIWADHVYFYLAVEENMKPKETTVIVDKMMLVSDMVAKLPREFVLSVDHMVNVSTPLTLPTYDVAVQRFSDTKHSEVLIGIKLLLGDKHFKTATDLSQITDALALLLPIYNKLK
ncbi:DUF1054 family protein [Leuconostoc aquikimchii]|uniref:DUF1054 family protein n=1 Tax=Leuconostoc aquikimchii TaxID=3236804 RepID=UPI0038FD3BA0